MGVKVTNNGYATISAGITSTATTITLDSGQGARFPTLGAGDYFFGTLVDTSNNVEIVKVTARSSDSMTVVRGQDNTTARAYAIGDRFELRPTAALFEAIQTEAANAAEVVNDTTPQLGGNLDGQSYNITTTGNIGINTTTPGADLDVQGNITCTGVLQHGTNSIDIYDGDLLKLKAGYAGSAITFSVGTGLTERMRIDASGRLTTPYQPSFSVGLTSGGGSGTVVWNLVKENNGGHYNTSNGVFTAPVAGRYFFSLFTMSANSGTVDIELRRNGSTIQHLVPYASSTGGQHNHVSGSAVVYLNANDTIVVNNNNVALYTHSGGRHHNWTGFLIG